MVRARRFRLSPPCKPEKHVAYLFRLIHRTARAVLVQPKGFNKQKLVQPREKEGRHGSFCLFFAAPGHIGITNFQADHRALWGGGR